MRVTHPLPKQMRYQAALHPDMPLRRGIPSLLEGVAQQRNFTKSRKNRNNPGTRGNPRHNHDTLEQNSSRDVLAGAGA